MPAPGEEKLPKDFGKYRLKKRIATGGMAEIFLAEVRGSPAPVVVKRILPHLAESAEFVSMFLDEARIAARLTHPNIVTIEDVGQIAGAYYIAMEYIHGEDVRRIYNQAYKLQRSLPLSHSIRVVAEAARGLEFAHTLEDDLTRRKVGVVHRDVSPQNILVTYQGGVKVVDFGIAKAANKVNQTRAGVLKGKYSYMSPEQAVGDPIDHRTDIFALGIILYETTTGTRLFKRQNELATLQAVIKCEVTPPSDALPGYPVELEKIVLRSLEKEPRDRYQSAAELADDLVRFLKSSRLFVEPKAIEEFMADLFAERLAEERASGQPVLPLESEARAEMNTGTEEAPTDDGEEPDEPSGAPRSRRPVSTFDTNDAASAVVKAVPAVGGLTEDTRVSNRAQATYADEGPPGFDGAEVTSDDAPEGTVPEDEAEDLVARAKKGTAADQAPTVVHAAYRHPVMSPEKPERVSGADDATAFVRTVQPKKSLPPTPVRPRPSAPPKPASRRPAISRRVWLGAAGLFGAGLVIAVIAGMMLPRGGAVAGEGEVTVHTEPGAKIELGDRVLGSAGPDGAAGPFKLPAGPQNIRVTVGQGSVRERSVYVRAGGVHEIEVRARAGFLKLAVAPWARVIIDGREVGITPLAPISLPEGQHLVVLDNPDLRRKHVSDLLIEGNRTQELKVDLAATGLEY